MSQTGQQITIIYMLPNISRSRGNQAIKFGHLIKYSVTNIFLQKSCKKWDGETSSRTFFVFFVLKKLSITSKQVVST